MNQLYRTWPKFFCSTCTTSPSLFWNGLWKVSKVWAHALKAFIRDQTEDPVIITSKNKMVVSFTHSKSLCSFVESLLQIESQSRKTPMTLKAEISRPSTSSSATITRMYNYDALSSAFLVEYCSVTPAGVYPTDISVSEVVQNRVTDWLNTPALDYGPVCQAKPGRLIVGIARPRDNN